MSAKGFTDEEGRTAWNEGAQGWDHFVESGADYYRHQVHGPALLEVCEPLRGLRVLDLGCGQGFFTRALAQRGALAVGVDLSDALVRIAREHEERTQLGVEYHRMGAAEVGREWAGGSFDLVTSCMALQDMSDPAAVLRAAAAVVRPGGRMAFSVPHPATDTPVREWERDAQGTKLALKVDRYFDTGADVCEWNMQRLRVHWRTPFWHSTLGEWSDRIQSAGFLIRSLREPRPTPEQVRHDPRLEDCARVPYFLIFDLARPG